ncbi:MAG: hypothetical protein ACR2OZ_12715 [Verrucomicrobiales bacterium]
MTKRSVIVLAWAGCLAVNSSLCAQVTGANSFAARPALTLNGGAATGLGSNLTASAEPGEPQHMAHPAARSLWWRWTAPISAVAEINTIGTSFDTRLVVYTGSTLGSLQRLAGNVFDDSSPFSESAVRFVAVAGTSYAIVVDGYDHGAGAQTGNVLLSLVQPAPGTPPKNDDFAAATSLGNAASATATGDVFRASVEAGEPDAETTFYPSGPGRSVWFLWTAPTTGYFTVQIDGGDTDWEPALGIYRGSSLASLIVIDKGEPLAFEPGASTASLVTATFQAFAGQVFRIVVAAKSFTATYGSFQLVLKAAQRPENDDFAAAEDLGTDSFAVAQSSLLESTSQLNEPNHFTAVGINPSYSSASVWWKWTPPASGTFTLDTRGSDGDTVLVVYRALTNPASFAALQSISFNDDIHREVSAFSSVLTFSAAAADVYYFAVSGYALSSTVRLHLAPGPPRVPFEAWLLDFPSLSDEEAERDADPDRDGLSNLLELVLGTNPTQDSHSTPVDGPRLPEASNDETQFYLDIGYSRENTNGLSTGTGSGGSPITLTAEKSSDLKTWTTDPPLEVSLGSVSGFASVPFSPGTLQFLRFKVVDPNPRVAGAEPR